MGESMGLDAKQLPPAMADPLLKAYLTHLQVEKRLAWRSLDRYGRSLNKLAVFCAGEALGWAQVHMRHVRTWVAKLNQQGHSASGIAHILSAWRGFYAWLGMQQLCSSNPVQGVRAPKSGKPLPKALGVDDAMQLANFRAHTELDGAQESRNAAIVELLYGSGLRVGELVGLDVVPSTAARGWLDLQEASVYVTGKGSKPRVVPLTQTSIVVIQEWLSHRQRNPKNTGQSALFTGRNGSRLSAQAIWQQLRQRSARAGLSSPVHPHMLRHSFASHILQSSGDLRGVQELLGHANIGTTQIYTRLDYQHLAQVYDQAHPRAKKSNK